MWSVLLNRVESRNISQEIKVNLIFVHAAELIQNSKGNVSDVDSLLQNFEKFENFKWTRLFNNFSKRAILSLFYVRYRESPLLGTVIQLMGSIISICTLALITEAITFF